jgi:acetylornithine deacetylase/succinyl-diaminopimelate desuccinylase-like protein
MTDDVLARINNEEAAALEELKEYLRIPSISTDPAYAPQVRRCANWVVAKLSAIGFAVELLEEGGHPLVYAERIEDPALPTLLFYGHYDVQPVDPIELWRNDPFEPTLEGQQLVARGATDDKGQSFAHIRGVQAVLEQRGRLPVNVKFLIEGEEESGGESIERFVRRDAGNKLCL